MKNRYISNVISEFRLSIRLASPLIASELFYALSAFIATIMVAQLGKEELAANALVWIIYIAAILFFIGIFNACSIMIAQSFGAKDNSGISICFKQGLILAIILAIPMMLIMWFSPTILHWTKQDPIIIQKATPFFHSLIWTILPMNIVFVIQQFLIGITKTRLVMLTNIVSVPIQIFFYYVFLLGNLGAPKLGLAGIGISLTLGHLFITIIFSTYLFLSQQFKIYRLFENWWVINKKFMRELLRVGLPLGFLYCVEVTLFVAVANMMGILDTDVLAAYQIAYQYLMIGLVIIFALTQSATVRIGNEVGQNNRDSLKLVNLINIAISLGIMLIFGIFYIGFPLQAISIDIDIYSPQLQEVVKYAKQFLPIIGILLLTDSLRLISLGSLRGLKDTKISMLISILGFWGIAFVSAYLLAFKFNFGGAGILWGIVIGLFITGVILFLRFNYLVKKINLTTLVTKQ